MIKQSSKMVVTAMGVTALALIIAAARDSACQAFPTEWADAGRLPRIRPDYGGIVIPPNIAPLNFLVEEPAVAYRVRIRGTSGKAICIGSRSPAIMIAAKPWSDLLNASRGGKIWLDCYAKGEDGRWYRFDVIENGVAQEEIDSHLVYRLLGPVGNLYRKLGIYQRNLESYAESPIVVNDSFGGCISCHSFHSNRPDQLAFHVRPGPQSGKVPAGMILVRDGHAARLRTESQAAPMPPGYLSWRPDGLAVAFSLNLTRQYFRTSGPEIRDVFDIRSDLAIAYTGDGATSTSPCLSDPNMMETFPAWSADGHLLYYCSAKPEWGGAQSPDAESIRKVKYDLMRVPYDLQSKAWGVPEMVLAASETGKTILEPRASPDGRYLLFCMSDYGSFPIQQPGSDLYLMDLRRGTYRRLMCNGDQADSWHCWSSNSRWIVFSSKRDNGLLARPYFSYIDAEGREHKPFVLPQKNPAHYDTWLKTYNVPELVTGPVTVPREELVQAICCSRAADEPDPDIDSAHGSGMGGSAAPAPAG